MSQISNYFWPLMDYYYLDENVTPSRIEHSRSSTLLPYAIDVDPDRQETSSLLDRLEAKDEVIALQPHTSSIWHGFSPRRGPARKSTSASSRKQLRKGRVSEWSVFSWILKGRRSTPSETSSGSVNTEKSAEAEQTVTTPSSASWTTSSISSPYTTSFKLSYGSDNSSFTSLSIPPSPADVVVLDPYTFDILSSQTHESSDTEISADMQGQTNEQVKAGCSDSLLDRSLRRYHTNTTILSGMYLIITTITSAMGNSINAVHMGNCCMFPISMLLSRKMAIVCKSV
ncbi:hypothetical protein BDQ17DRAFT_216465 [Cyathus striatus]|nr:hypothetical protein BDQ17DRAFT_216465 [Cyathus striatus]